jgi:CheY-like chemotaxis protein
VLVIEDNAVNQEVARAMLTRLGLTVTIAGNGQSALDLIATTTFNLIFMDCQLPVMDGMSATRRMRADGYQLPIVAMTANALPGDRQACLDAGMNEYLAKPITIDRLKKTLTQFLGPATTTEGT